MGNTRVTIQVISEDSHSAEVARNCHPVCNMKAMFIKMISRINGHFAKTTIYPRWLVTLPFRKPVSSQMEKQVLELWKLIVTPGTYRFQLDELDAIRKVLILILPETFSIFQSVAVTFSVFFKDYQRVKIIALRANCAIVFKGFPWEWNTRKWYQSSSVLF